MSEKPRLSFIRSLKNSAREYRLPTTFYEQMQKAHVSIRIEGSTHAWRREGTGVLFLGDHKQLVEPVVLGGALGKLGRNDAHFIGLAYAVPKIIDRYIGLTDAETLLPVLPGYLTKSSLKAGFSEIPVKKEKIVRKLARLRHGRKLTEEKRLAINAAAVTRATQLLDEGHAVTIFPTSGGVDMTATWYPGAAKILLGIPVEKRKNIILAPFSCGENLVARKLTFPLVKRIFGIPSTSREFTITFGRRQQTVFDVLGRETDSTKATAKLKEYYFENLNIDPTPKVKRRLRAN